MITCEHTSGQLLDFLYGLLQEDELGEVRAHLDACATCQAALKQAQEQQRLFAQAARVCEEVKPFAAPDFDAPLAEPAPAAASLPTALEPALPVPPQAKGTGAPPRVRLPRWMTFTAVALAASVLLALVLGETYSAGLAQRETQLAEARSAVQATEASFTRAQSGFNEQMKSLPAEQAREVLHLQVSAPAQYHPQAPTSCTVEVTGLAGQPRAAKVGVQVLDRARKVLAKQEIECAGLQTVQLPAGLAAADDQVTFEVSAQADSVSAKIEGKLRQVEPKYVTHLATNKTAYRIGDLLFFRTVTLENFSLKPAANALPLRFSLVSLDGKIVKQLPVSQTAKGGISGGEFALTADMPSGIYYLEVAAAQANGPVMQRRRLEVIRDDTPQIVFDGKKQYYEGEPVPFDLVERHKQATLPNTPLTIQPLVPLAGASVPPPAQQTVTDSKGKGKFTLPGNSNSTRAPVRFQLNDGKNNSSVVQSVPVIPSKITVDFYPEGGELVDGLPARIYYRVNSLDGEPVVPKGKIVFRSSKGVLYESPVGQATGVFTFTPSITESYAVRVTDPQFEVVQADPIEKIGVLPRGLTLSIPAGVTADGEAIRILLANKGQAKRVVVLISCRGQIVQHETVQLGEGRTELKLTPPAGIAGVLRVTAYEAGPAGLAPLAERLVFRMPGRKLELDCKLGTYARGQKAQLEIKGVDEAKRPTGYFALAYVVDAKVKTEKDVDLPTHFYLAGDVPGDDLEQAQIVLRDDPASKQALDLFLGAQPWRRLAVDAGPALVAQNGQDAPLGQLREQEAAAKAMGKRVEQQDRRRGAAGSPVLLSLENASAGQLQALYETRLAKSVAAARSEFVQVKNGLAQTKDAQSEHFRSVALDLAEFRHLPQFYLRQAMSIVVLLCLALGGVLLLVGMIAILRQRSATVALGGSFAAFGLCMVLYLTARQVSVEIADHQAEPKLDVRAWPRMLAEGPPPAQEPIAKIDAAMLPPGQYALAQNLELQVAVFRGADRAERSLAAAAPKAAMDGLSMAKLADTAGISNQLGGPGFPGHTQEKEQRFGFAKKIQEPASPVGQGGGGAGHQNYQNKTNLPAAPSVTAKKETAKDADKLKKADFDVQGALAMQNAPYIWPKQGHPDTIVWFPALVTANGVVPLSFPLPNQAATYRVIVHGHTDDGRLGYFEGNLEVK